MEFIDNLEEERQREYLENISAEAYYKNMQSILEIFTPSKLSTIIPKIIWLVCISVIVLAVVTGKGKYIILSFFAVPFVAGVAFMIYMKGRFNYISVGSVLKKMESDMKMASYTTEVVAYKNQGIEFFVKYISLEDRERLGRGWVPQYLVDDGPRGNIYRFNGLRGEISPFKTGQMLEITYYTTSKVVKSIRMLEENK